jgi:hypothetical protein
MDSEGPDTLTGREIGGQSTEDSVSAAASARVGEVLAKAEAEAVALREEAERQAESVENAARSDAERIAEDARLAVQAAARDRAHEISRLRSSIAARAGSLVDGLEGAELTRTRLEELVAALGDAADGLLEEVGVQPDQAENPGPAARDQGSDHATGADDVGGAVAYEGPIPEGAPMARRPKRARQARFAAVLMAIQGRERDDVEDHLVREYGVADCDQLLDDVFGNADAKA